MKVAAALCLLATAAAAQGQAERAVQLIREGAELGRSGDFGAAIARFKEADRLSPAWPQDCNIGHAYVLWNRLAQAWLFLEQCVARPGATAGFAAELDEVSKVLATADYAPIEVVASGPAELVIVSLSFEERWRVDGPRRLWLPLGQHTLELSARGFVPRRETLDVVDRAPRSVSVVLEPLPVRPPVPPPPLKADVASRPPVRRWALLPGAFGVAALGVGLGLLIHSEQLRAELRRDPPVARAFELSREGATFQVAGLFPTVIGAALLVTATLLWLLGGAEEGAGALRLP